MEKNVIIMEGMIIIMKINRENTYLNDVLSGLVHSLGPPLEVHTAFINDCKAYPAEV